MTPDHHNRLLLEVIALRDRVQRLELELALEKQALAYVTAERDRARGTAIALEQEIAHVPYRGEAS